MGRVGQLGEPVLGVELGVEGGAAGALLDAPEGLEDESLDVLVVLVALVALVVLEDESLVPPLFLLLLPE